VSYEEEDTCVICPGGWAGKAPQVCLSQVWVASAMPVSCLCRACVMPVSVASVGRSLFLLNRSISRSLLTRV
jgi:hypothetical protein